MLCDWMHIDVSNDNEHKRNQHQESKSLSQAIVKTHLCDYKVRIIISNNVYRFNKENASLKYLQFALPLVRIHTVRPLSPFVAFAFIETFTSFLKHAFENSTNSICKWTATITTTTTAAAAATVKHILCYLVKLLSWHNDCRSIGDRCD